MPNVRNPETGAQVRASRHTADKLIEQGWEEIVKHDDSEPTPEPAAAPAAGGTGDGKKIDDLTGKELDAAAATLAVDGWNAKAKIPAKRDALKEVVAAKLAEHNVEGLTYESPIDDLTAALAPPSE